MLGATTTDGEPNLNKQFTHLWLEPLSKAEKTTQESVGIIHSSKCLRREHRDNGQTAAWQRLQRPATLW